MGYAIPITELSRHLSEYLNRVAYKGESFVLLRGKKPLAELRPAPRGKRLGELAELLKSLPHLSEEESAAFLADLKEARRGLVKKGLKSPWGS